MSRRNIFTDVAAILHPIPRFEPGEEEHEGFLAMRDQIAADQERAAEQLRVSWEEGDQDPLIFALADARRTKELAEEQIRALLAYGREFVQPRPYTLGDLAGAAGMSISGVRTAYGHHDVDAVADATGAKPREWRAPDKAGPTVVEDEAAQELVPLDSAPMFAAVRGRPAAEEAGDHAEMSQGTAGRSSSEGPTV